MDKECLVSLYDFENRQGLFPGTHRSYKFSLLTLTGDQIRAADFAFFLHTVNDLAEEECHFTLTRTALALLNPNTRTCPIFRNRKDAELTRKIYEACPVLHNEETGENPWGVSFLRMFDMTNDSHLFRTRDQLEAEGCVPEANRFVRGDEVYLPLYEDWTTHQYDHRYLSHEPESSGAVQHERADALPLPRYWVESGAVEQSTRSLTTVPEWFLAFRNRTRSTDVRTAIFAVIPYSAVGNPLPLILCNLMGAPAFSALLGNLNCLPFDYLARQKIGGLNLNFYIVQQLPVLAPDRYTTELLKLVAPRVVELIYTAWDIKAFADDVWRQADEGLRGAIIRQWEANAAETGGHVGAEPPSWAELAPDGFPHPPFKWDEERRARLRAELDALYAHLYGLTREELDYILDTFPIVRRKDEEKYGEYRTKRMVLEQYDALEGRFD